MKTNKGISAEIYRGDYKCTLNKFEDKKSVIVPCDGGVFESDEDCPDVILIERDLRGYGKYPQVDKYIHAEPAVKEAGEYFAFGGNFIYSSDSRFPSKYPIPLHDRRMNLE